jgi:hypothetical protein
MEMLQLTVMQQALLRYYGNAVWCIDHVTKENPYMSHYLRIQCVPQTESDTSPLQSSSG